jgi:uroporphyrinogen decarboxylase
VLIALDHREPDKVPVDFAATRASGINAIAYNNLLGHLNLKLENFVYDFKQLLSDVDDRVRKFMGGDVIQLHRLAPSLGVKLNSGVKRITLPDGSEALVSEMLNYQKEPSGNDVIFSPLGEVLFRRPKDGLYFDDVYHPLAEVESNDDIDRGFKPPTILPEELDFLKVNGKKLFEETSYAVLGSTSIGIFQQGIKDFGFAGYLMSDPDLVGYYLEKLTGAYIAILDQYLDAVGDNIQIIHLADDYGTQNSTLISQKTFQTIFKPWHTKINSFIKSKKPRLKIMLHCCGAIAPLIPDFIEAGFDILNPIQLSAAGMDPRMLKREYGKSITFWGGGCSSQTTLTFKSPAEVRQETEEMIGILAPGGGYVFCQDHNIQSNVSPENIIALYDAVKHVNGS